LQGAEHGLVDFDGALRDLLTTDFRCTPRLIGEVNRRAQRRV
jgi:hypothetical protein